MEVFFIDSDDFLKTHDKNFLHSFAEGREFRSEKRFLQYAIGRYLVKTVAEKIYGLSDTTIVIKNDKPKFKSREIYFNISHSKNLIAAVFDDEECGLDIEIMKPRDFVSFSQRYEKEFTSAEDFYKFWTEYEAEIKLGQPVNSKYSCVFNEKFMLTVASVKSEIPSVEPKLFDF